VTLAKEKRTLEKSKEEMHEEEKERKR